jgi:hypothetical protein
MKNSNNDNADHLCHGNGIRRQSRLIAPHVMLSDTNIGHNPPKKSYCKHYPFENIPSVHILPSENSNFMTSMELQLKVRTYKERQTV